MLLKDYVKCSMFFAGFFFLLSCDSWDKNEKETPITKIEVIDTAATTIDTTISTPIDSALLRKMEEENRVISKVKQLPECQRLEEIINEKKSGNKKRLDYQIVSRPTNKDPNFYVKVNEKDLNGTFVKLQVFVNAANDSIMIYDPGEDRLLSLEEWRKLENE